MHNKRRPTSSSHHKSKAAPHIQHARAYRVLYNKAKKTGGMVDVADDFEKHPSRSTMVANRAQRIASTNESIDKMLTIPVMNAVAKRKLHTKVNRQIHSTLASANRIVIADHLTTARHAMVASFSQTVADNRSQLYHSHVRKITTQAALQSARKASIDAFRSPLSKQKLSFTTTTSTTRASALIAPSAQSSAKARVTRAAKRAFSTVGDYPPHEVLAMPALSPTMEQGKISSWEKKVGDKVMPGDVLCNVETDKATVSFDSTEEGYLAKILIEAGAGDILVGKPVAILVEDEESVAKFANYSADAPAPAAAAAAPVKTETKEEVADKRPCGVYIAPESPKAPTISSSGTRVLASPLARVTAAENNVDLSTVKGTGMYDSITKRDVLSAPAKAVEVVKVVEQAAVAAAPKKAAPAPTAQQFAAEEGDYVDEPLTNMRKVIAKRLTESKQNIPHYYVTVEVEMDAVNKLRADFNKQLAAMTPKDQAPVKLSVNDFIIKATAGALKKVPEVNTTWHDTFIRKYNYADISVAVSTDAGLITPIVTDADIRGLASISTEMKNLAGKARANKLQPHEYQGGTFTISNLGMFGVDQFAAIINPPQAGILAIGGSTPKVVPNPKYDSSDPTSKEFKVVTVMKATGSFNHMSVDGAVGAKFLNAFKGYMENPQSLLL